MSEGSNSASEVDGEGRFALAFLPAAKEATRRVGEMLPQGTHYGVFVLVPVTEQENRVIAVTTDREIVGPAVAQWFLSTRKD